MPAHRLSLAKHEQRRHTRAPGSTLCLGLACLLYGCSGTFDAVAGPGTARGATDGNGQPPLADERYVAYLARRLTAEEYTYTVEDRLGVTLSAADRALLPPDRSPEGFAQIATSQATHPDHVLAYNTLSARIVATMDFEAYLSKHTPCRSPEGSCIGPFVSSAGRHLLRRPPTEREQQKLVALFEERAADGASFTEAAQAVVQAVLQFPQFLYLLPTEGAEGTLRRFEGYELASRLSYYLWSSAPDEELLEAAQNGSLDTREGLAAQVDRMLKDERRASRTTARWLWDWAQLQTLSTGAADERIVAAQAFFHDHLWTRGLSPDSLLTAPRAFLTPKLAQADGLKPAADGAKNYELPGGAGRIGLLSQPAVAAGMALGADGGQIVARGLFMLSKVFCGEPPPPPPESLAGAIAEFGEALPAGASYRLISDTRMENPTCAACHGRFDPLGFAFEVFDANGALQTEDAHGNAVRSDGWVPSYLTGTDKDVKHADLNEYMRFAASTEQVQRCLTRHFLEQALGASLTQKFDPSVGAVREAAQAAGGRYVDYARAIATSELFLQVATQGAKP